MSVAPDAGAGLPARIVDLAWAPVRPLARILQLWLGLRGLRRDGRVDLRILSGRLRRLRSRSGARGARRRECPRGQVESREAP